MQTMANVDLEALFVETIVSLSLTDSSLEVINGVRANIMDDVRQMFDFVEPDEVTPEFFKTFFYRAIKYHLCKAREYPEYTRAVEQSGVTPLSEVNFMTDAVLTRWFILKSHDVFSADSPVVSHNNRLYDIGAINPELTLQLSGIDDPVSPENCAIISYDIHAVIAEAIRCELSEYVGDLEITEADVGAEYDFLFMRILGDVCKTNDFRQQSFLIASRAVVHESLACMNDQFIYQQYVALMKEQELDALPLLELKREAAFFQKMSTIYKTGLRVGQTVIVKGTPCFLYRITPQLDVCLMGDRGLESFSLETFLDEVASS